MAPQDAGAQATDFVGACIRNLPSIANLTSGLADQNGKSTANLNDAWGISYTTCLQYCNGTAIPLSLIFDFQGFSQAFTNYLLPWLALTAQLPYETGSPWCNILSFCMAVGSPALATYSLSVTCLNRYWIRKRVEEIRRNSPAVESKCPVLFERLTNIEYFLSEAQQTPLRASQQNGWLSSLLLDPDNKDWWSRFSGRLERSRRGITFSLVAQVSSAFIAWIFVIISAFQASLGKPTAALQMSAGSLWIWLVPVISGWIIVGTQYKHDSIEEALNADVAHRALPPLPPAPPHTTAHLQRDDRQHKQKGISTRSGLPVSFAEAEIRSGSFQRAVVSDNHIPFSLGSSVIGDECQQGPVFNYARLFTWHQFAHTLTTAMEATFQNVEDGHNIHWDPAQVPAHPVRNWNPAQPDENLRGDAGELARYCGLQNPTYGVFPAYAAFSDMFFTAPAQVKITMVASAFLAVFVQWGTTGAAIIISYLTPITGLGCRSGSYLLYGIASTVGWLCLVASMMLSHAAMLMYQNLQQTTPDLVFTTRRRSPKHSLICGLAVTTRLLGKLVIICNAGWVVASSLMELIGVYDTCYCNSNYLSLGENGWALLFKSAIDLRASAATPWASGVAMSILTCMFSTLFFWLSSSRS